MITTVAWRGRTAAGENWVLTHSSPGFVLRRGVAELQIPGREAHRLQVVRTLWRTRLVVDGDGALPISDLRGLTRAEGRHLEQVLREVRLHATVAWIGHVRESCALAQRDLRWITEEEIAALTAARPDTAGLEQHAAEDDALREALVLTAEAARRRLHTVNDEVAAAVIESQQQFFDTVESSPLTEEQARAVVAYDNRVNVIAAAGSGKTSVMVARAAYAVHRGLARPEEILLLAFNRDAAQELQTRIQARFTAAGLSSDGVVATTFHAFGLQVIGQATGRKPAVAPWVSDGNELGVLSEIVDGLKAAIPRFTHEWDWFRLLHGRPEEDPSDPATPDAWDADRRAAGFRARDGRVVRSDGERMIADLLYLHGVRYEYEHPYTHDTATAERRQYHPDFYYPDIDVWHEHWGVDADGKPRPEWTGYEEGMQWKRQLHRERGTKLLETTWAGVMAGEDLKRLKDELTAHGIQLDWDPDRPIARGVRQVTDADLLRLVRSFMVHVKANALDRQEVERRVGAGRIRNRRRARLFLDLYWPIHDAWQARLTAAGLVDFEDMLVQAADHLESGRYASPYRLVMVDEFQDASRARARLTRALVRSPGRHLLAVGDDWQSINRFAGADLSVVTHFHDYFGPGPTVHLTRTFRSHQSITDTAARFVRKNPAQVAKSVTSVHDRPLDPAAHEGVQLRQVPSAAEVPGAIKDFLMRLQAARPGGAVTGGPVSVDVLGRYHQDRSLVPRVALAGIELTFRTIHASKGLEADYVVIPNLSAGAYAFPSRIADDPLLSLAMTGGDTYPHAEERRLFYVALTRARRGVLLISPERNPSPFVTELIQDRLVRGVGARPVATPCPGCGAGALRPRSGRTGHFWGCSTFPACTFTANTLPTPAAPTTTATASLRDTAISRGTFHDRA